MNKSESIAKLATALCKFQSQICTVQKNKIVKVKTRNGGEYEFPYADFDAIRTAIKEPLSENELSFSQLVSSEGLTTILMHSSGEYLESIVHLNMNQQPQELGSEVTYKKRYSLSSILGLSTDEDDDGNWSSGNTISKKSGVKEKPWYNDEQYNSEKFEIVNAIKGGMSADAVISQIQENYKMSNKMKDTIKALEVNNG